MTVKDHDAPPASASTFSQTMFVLTGLAIIAGGLWNLYMSDAPYHPKVVSSEGEIYLAQQQSIQP